MKELLLSSTFLNTCVFFVVTYLLKDWFIKTYKAVSATFTRQFQPGDEVIIQALNNEWERVEILEFCLISLTQKIGVYVQHNKKEDACPTIECIDFERWEQLRKRMTRERYYRKADGNSFERG